MRKALPRVTEDADPLKQRLQRTDDGRTTPRLQRLSRLARGRAQTRQEVAQLLGVHRHTMGHWRARYEARGLDALLALYVPAGKPLSLPPDGLAAITRALQQPTGFASDAALRQWVQRTYHLDVNDHTLDTMVRTTLKTKLKVARPSHTKNPRGHARVSGEGSRPAPARHPA
jgi:transposase